MATFDELSIAYASDKRPANIGARVEGALLGELDDEVLDVTGSYRGLRDDVGAWRVARLGLALAEIERILPAIEPAPTRVYFEHLALLARAALVEIADRAV